MSLSDLLPYRCTAEHDFASRSASVSPCLLFFGFHEVLKEDREMARGALRGVGGETRLMTKCPHEQPRRSSVFSSALRQPFAPSLYTIMPATIEMQSAPDMTASAPSSVETSSQQHQWKRDNVAGSTEGADSHEAMRCVPCSELQPYLAHSSSCPGYEAAYVSS